MSNMIQLPNVPDALHRSLKAAMAGMSLSDCLWAEIKEIAERPTPAEFTRVALFPYGLADIKVPVFSGGRICASA